MLFLIGLGLAEGNMPYGAIEALKSSSIVLYERYTSFVSNAYIESLEKLAGKKFKEIDRPELEQNAASTVAMARDKSLAILVPGDPLIVTTHKLLLDEAEKQGVDVKVMHAPSILSAAIGESRLSLYRFGQCINVPFWQNNYKPTSFIRVVRENLDRNLHSLLFLDIDHENKRPMLLEEALFIMQEADKAENTGIFSDSTLILALAGIGTKEEKKVLFAFHDKDKASRLVNGLPITLVIPASISFSEEGVMHYALR